MISGFTCAAGHTVRSVCTFLVQQWPMAICLIVMASALMVSCRRNIDLEKIFTQTRLYKHRTFIESFVVSSNRLPYVITEHLLIAPISAAEITGHGGLQYDGWDREFFFERKNDKVVITSFGADGIRGTSDDLILQCTTSSASLLLDGKKEDISLAPTILSNTVSFIPGVGTAGRGGQPLNRK
jgi:hypothetical protein